MIRFILELMTVVNAHAQQIDVLKCDTGRNHLRIYRVINWSGDNHFFEFKSGSFNYGFYLRGGPITPSYVNGKPGKTFKNDLVRVIHLFGQYNYISEEFNATFFDSDCEEN